MPTRILHLSDLHVGAHDAPLPSAETTALVDRIDPALVVASGDLTHRGRPEQHDRAATYLRSLERPVLAVPGNHDIPFLPPARMTRPYAEFERVWGTAEPVHTADGLLVVGLNSVRPWRHQSGAVGDEQVDRAEQLLRHAPEGALRVVVLHHHAIGAPWRSRKKPVANRSHVFARLVDAGAELILSGHIHQVTVAERRDFAVTGADHRSVVVSVAPGFERPRPRRLGEAQGLHVYEADERSIRVETHIRQDDGWARTAIRRFPRGTAALD